MSRAVIISCSLLIVSTLANPKPRHLSVNGSDSLPSDQATKSTVNINLKTGKAVVGELGQSGFSNKTLKHQEDDGRGYSEHPKTRSPSSTKLMKNWLYALLTMMAISILGLLAIITVPVMQKIFYEKIITLLIALAIGCLTGDALLHLLPHAFEDNPHDGNDTNENHGDHHHGHRKTVLRALCAILGIYVFLLSERMGKRKGIYKMRKRLHYTKIQAGNTTGSGSPMSTNIDSTKSNLLRDSAAEQCQCDHIPVPAFDHHHHHHGLAGAEGGKATANMLVIGDAMHNFADGLAVGASFADHVSAGICTAIAVVCHELPHEIGLFAVLMRLKMTVRQAMFFNCVSSVSSIAGAMFGLYVGQRWDIAPWIFAIIAGIFLYLALVDMLPQLTIDEEYIVMGFVLEAIGFASGLAIMTVIALYEDRINELLPRTM